VRILSDLSPLPTRLFLVWACSFCCLVFSTSRSFAASSDMALALFLCWDLSSWHSTTMPEGRWVRRMAESVLLTCWPPAPEARKVSILSSCVLISISSISLASGIMATVQAEVWILP